MIPKICVSLGSMDYETCRRHLKRTKFAELRLDLLPLSLAQIHRLFAGHPLLIATCRPARGGSEKERIERLVTAIRAGAAYVDIELDATAGTRKLLLSEARRCDCRIIVSHHDHRGTPSRQQLQALLRRLFHAGADIAKIACRIRSQSDLLNLLALYTQNPGEKRLLALGMGKLGTVTRLVAPILGAPFTFASMDEKKTTASGQLTVERMRDVLCALTGETQ